MLILSYTISPLLNALNEANVTGGDFVYAIGEIVVLVVIFLALLILPVYFIYKAVTEGNHKIDPVGSSIKAVIIFFFGILITIKVWYMFPIFAGLLDDGLVRGVFYTGLFLVWVGNLLIVPATMIITKES